MNVHNMHIKVSKELLVKAIFDDLRNIGIVIPHLEKKYGYKNEILRQ